MWVYFVWGTCFSVALFSASLDTILSDISIAWPKQRKHLQNFEIEEVAFGFCVWFLWFCYSLNCHLSKGLVTNQDVSKHLVPWGSDMVVRLPDTTSLSKAVSCIQQSLVVSAPKPSTQTQQRCQKTWSQMCKLYLGARSIVTHMCAKTLIDRLGVVDQTYVGNEVRMLGSLAFFCSLLFVSSALAFLLGSVNSGVYERRFR